MLRIKNMKGDNKMNEEKEFNTVERIILLNFMPREGGYFNIKKVREVREELGLNEEEIKILTDNTTALADNKSQTNWTAINDQVGKKAVDFGEWLTNQIVDRLKKLHDDEKITEDHLNLYKMFVMVDKKAEELVEVETKEDDAASEEVSSIDPIEATFDALNKEGGLEPEEESDVNKE